MKKFILFLSIVLLSIICYGQIHISNEYELRAFADTVNDGTSYVGQTIILDNDIELAGNWTPIGKSGMPFKGTFEGNGHKISNLNIVNQDYAGLFGYINEGTIQNITVYGNISISGKKRIGGVCGLMQNNSKIENCHFIGQIYANTSGDVYAGGVIGEILEGGTVNKCSSTGLIYGETDKAKCIGGIVGRSGPESNGIDVSYKRTLITNCINLSDVYGLSSVGGIIAYIRHNVTVENCLNCGNINGFEGSKNYFGGIVGGYYFGMRVYNCLSAATTVSKNPSAAIGKVTGNDFPDTCPKINVYYDYQRMYLNHSTHGTSAYTSGIIDGSLSSTFTGWIFDGDYPYPKDFTYDSVIMVAKSYALFSNDEKYDAIETDFTVSNFTGTSWMSKQDKVSVRTPNIVLIDTGIDTLVVNYGSYYKNIILNIESYDPLPITLLEFSVEPRYDHQTGVHVLNLLTIRTGYEYNNCEFIVYRSEDAINWDYDNPVCKWDFGKDSAIYNEALDIVLNYFTIEHPNGQTYYPVDTIPYPVTYYKLIQRDCDNTTTEYTSEIIVCIANQQKNLIEPYVICDNGPQVVGGSEVCEVFVQNVLGQMVEEFQLQPYQQREVLAEIQGMYLITFVYKYNGEARKKTEKIICM